MIINFLDQVQKGEIYVKYSSMSIIRYKENHAKLTSRTENKGENNLPTRKNSNEIAMIIVQLASALKVKPHDLSL